MVFPLLLSHEVKVSNANENEAVHLKVCIIYRKAFGESCKYENVVGEDSKIIDLFRRV